MLGLAWDGQIPVRVRYIAERLGILIEETTGKNGGTSVTLDAPVGARAVIKFCLTDDPIRQRFAIAHALGHYALGHLTPLAPSKLDQPLNYRLGTSDRHETEANQFALELLVPTEELKRVHAIAVKKGKTDPQLLANAFAVSLPAMIVRLEQTGITPKQADTPLAESTRSSHGRDRI